MKASTYIIIPIGQHQKKMALQGKMLHLRQKIRKESFLQPGGMKKVMNAPTILQAFKSQVSVSKKISYEPLQAKMCL